MYVVFVGEASTGKGEVIRPIKKLLSSYKILPGRPLMAYDASGNPIEDDPDISKFANNGHDEDFSEMSFLDQDFASSQGIDAFKDDLLFPSPFDSSSLRGLTKYIANAARVIKYMKKVGDQYVPKMYGHSSAALMLNELTTLIKDDKETVKIVTFLNDAWDCGDYRHGTASSGSDIIKTNCLSMLGGTTPDLMADAFTSKTLSQGMSARAIFIYDNNKLPNKRPTPLTGSQNAAYEHIKSHLFKLAHLYGPVEFTPEAYNYHMEWFEKDCGDRSRRINKSKRLDHFYGRYNMHVLKLAMAIHFADRLDRVITLPDILEARRLLEYIEPNMHEALRGKARNELSDVMKDITQHVRANETLTEKQIVDDFVFDATPDEIRTMLRELCTLGKLAKLDGRYVIKQQSQYARNGKRRF